jgi:two-component system OmpR family response regulator
MSLAEPKHPILLVEDDPTIASVLREALRSEGLPVDTAENGFAALRKMEEGLPALLVLDVGLPTLRGDSVGLGARTSWTPQELPILLISALPMQDLREVIESVEPFACLHKPFDLKEFVETVRRGLDARG